MKKYKILTFLFLSFNIYASGQTTVTLRIDPENARGGTASEIFDSIQFTSLETTKESLFGAVDQLEVTDSFFFILDVQSRSILIFNKSGTLHAKISTGGIDKYFSYFSLDRSSHSIIVTNNYASGLLIYDFNGNFLRREISPDNIQTLYYFGNKKMLYNFNRAFFSKDASGVPYDLAYANGYNTIIEYLNAYNSKIEDGEYNIFMNPFNSSGEQGSCMFSLPFDYKVYQLNDTGIIHQYNFIFPLQYSLPTNFVTDGNFSGHRAEYVYKDHSNYKKIHGVSTVYKLDDYLIFSARNGDLSMSANFNYLYNLRNDHLVSFSRVSGDSTSFYLPLLSSIFEKIDAVYKNEIYSAFPSFRIFSIEKNLNRDVTYPQSLKKLLSTGNKNNNPVIVQFKIKKNL